MYSNYALCIIIQQHILYYVSIYTYKYILYILHIHIITFLLAVTKHSRKQVRGLIFAPDLRDNSNHRRERRNGSRSEGLLAHTSEDQKTDHRKLGNKSFRPASQGPASSSQAALLRLDRGWHQTIRIHSWQAEWLAFYIKGNQRKLLKVLEVGK